jgi:hypothetical protein
MHLSKSEIQVLVLASGEQNRWEKTGKPGPRKQLLPLNGETIIERIIRQCRDRGADPIVVTHHGDIMEERGAIFLPVRDRRWTVETLLSTAPHWRERTVILLGDVIYSKAVIDRIYKCRDPIRVFGNELEIFGLSFSLDMWSDVSKALEVAIGHAENGGPGKLRKFYQAYCGLNLDSPDMEKTIIDWVCHITDYTRDVDTPEDYATLRLKVIDGGRLDDLCAS